MGDQRLEVGDVPVRGALVQLLWPDRNGFLPYEIGFDQRMRFAQPVIGRAVTVKG